MARQRLRLFWSWYRADEVRVGDINQMARFGHDRWLMISLLRLFMMCGVLVLAVHSGASAQSCTAGPATLQILGSAGPAFNKDRARRAICCGSTARLECSSTWAAAPISGSLSRARS